MYSKMLCLNNWDVFHNPAEKDCSPGRRCGGDCEIFLESGWATRGNANTMFALAKPCLHGFWTPRMASVSGPVMMRGTWPLPFRKSTVVASIRVRGGQPFLRGFYGPLRYEPCTQFINVSQRTLHIYWQFSAMSLAIHKIVSKRRCQSYFISQRSPHHGISKDSDLCASAHRCPHYAYARLCFH